ncbi:hypothetical protein EGR_03442 [Echinococcus granulosus]|uniref:Iojap protein n=1 Tax=Echinococcus granulosus TaxID=6210 RepID=W6UKL6_ECHGR|nr:hypothetical protein EGR_03442 [Echinococcus granulosus]EUB61628.1 hypothetical protein EGR_03442 [Echinococcus granulosus]
MFRPTTLACGIVSRHFRGLRPGQFSFLNKSQRVFYSNPGKNFISVGNADTDEDDIIEVFDLPVEPQFEENPEFEYVSQSVTECRYPFISNKRSRGGVFNLPEVVQFLRAEKFSDVVAIRIPEVACYGDFMVVATAKSNNHVYQASKILQELFKMKRASSDSIPSFEGLKERSEWVAVDLGNIILHMFAKVECRQRYDLESLWGIGPEFDEKTQGLEVPQSEVDSFPSMRLTQADWERIVAEVAAE